MNLPPNLVNQWNAYLAAERSGVRSLALAQLDAFIESLRRQSDMDWQNWAAELSEAILDGHREIPVRMPLFRSVIFPALHGRLTGGSGSAARILGGFSHLLCQSPECRALLPPPLQTEHGLILEAVRRDASDFRSKHRLRAILRDRFKYSLHELPSGILYGQNGASVEQCAEMMDELKDYAGLCDEIGAEDADREIIAQASSYLPAYRDYLLHLESYDSFAEYIGTHIKRKDEPGVARAGGPATPVGEPRATEGPPSGR
jgi:hypothetical protein